MSTPVPQCSNTAGWDQILNKDDTGKLMQISFTFTLGISVSLLLYTFYNIYELFLIRNVSKVTIRMIMHILISFYLITSIVIFLDGPVSLFGQGSGILDLRVYYMMNYTALATMELAFIFATYNWAQPLGNTFGYNRNKVNKYRIGYSLLISVSLIASIIGIDLALGGSQNICNTLVTYDNGLGLWVIILSIVMEVNNIVISISCYLLAKKLQILYEHKDTTASNRMKGLALFSAIGLTFRATRDILETFDLGPFDGIERAANTPGASISNQVPWAIVFFLYEAFCGLIPVMFLSINFSVSTKQRTRAGSLKSSLIGAGDEKSSHRVEPIDERNV